MTDNKKTESSPSIKRKLTPLFLLSKMKKNSQVGSDRQSALALIERQQKKINNRYGEIMDRRRIRTEANNTCSQEIKGSSGEEGKEEKPPFNKIQEILRKSSKKSRFYSVKRSGAGRDASPYLSQEKKRVQNERDNQEDSHSALKAKLMRKIKQQKAESKTQLKRQKSYQAQPEPEPEAPQERKTVKPPCSLSPQKILTHFLNLQKISQALHTKKQQRQVIPLIKSYVLSQQADSSEVEGLYVEESVCEDARKVLWLEKILIVVLVDLIINRKLKLAEVFVKSAAKIAVRFYVAVYRDLDKAGLLPKTETQALRVLKQVEGQSKLHENFSHIQLCLQSKLKTILKFARPLQKYYSLHRKSIHASNPNLCYFRLLQFYSQSLLGSNWQSWNIQFLEVCPSPYLHHEPEKTYTLVLDLDETLIHYKMGTPANNYQGEFLIRPYLFQFLQQMSQLYQIGIFTCSVPQYANIILNHLKHISFRLYRHHTIRYQGEYIKDLSRIGRDLRTLVMVDNLEHNFKLQKGNGIHVRSWYGDRADDVLKRLAVELRKLAGLGCGDFRDAGFERKFL